jgi:ABC-type multidrug transport system fused ATPase/permease subunit
MKPLTANTETNGKHLAKLVFRQAYPYRKWLLLIFFAMIIQTLMDIATPWPLKIVIDNVIGNHALPSWLQWLHPSAINDSKLQMAAFAAFSLIIITVIGALASYAYSYFTESVAQYVANDVRQEVYHHLQRLSLGYYDTHQVGKLLSTITTDVSTMQDFVSTTLLNIVVDAMTIIGILSLMFFINWSFALMAIAVTPFLLVFVFRFKKAVKKSTREVRKDESEMLAVLQQGLESIRVINAFGTQETEENRLKKVSMETVHAALKTRRLKALVSPIVSVIVTLCLALVLWRGSSLVLTGVMTVGSLTVLITYLTKFFSPVKDLAKMTNAVAQATVSLERIQQILATDDVVPEKTNAIIPQKLNGEIIFENVSFGYSHSFTVLKNISIKINPGERIGICGQTGCGKSTIAGLISRFYDPSGGRILIDGIDVADYNLEALRKQVGFVLQDTFLFYGSVAENIAYGKPAATEEEIIHAARLADAEEFILKMPQGYSTLVGERGVTLSGGQRQRIGIARAIIRNSPILILDEPTSALDSESEKTVIDALEKLMEGKTVITIAHRLSTIRNSDRIIVIKDGVIEEEGTHEALMGYGKFYSQLYQVRTRTGISVNDPAAP